MPEDVLAKAKALRDALSSARSAGPNLMGWRAQVQQFLTTFAGPNSAFARGAVELKSPSYDGIYGGLLSLLDGFIAYLEAGLQSGTSPERKGQLEVVSDLMDLSQRLLEDSSVHPAASAMVIGATLEEFLRTWCEAEGLSVGSPLGIDAYTKALRTADLITKQDAKDITSWAGTRNHAAHGRWEEVSDRQRIRLLLEGVNLFLRRYSPESGV